MASGTRNRVVIIGLDGATFDAIDPLIDGGRLPHIARLMAKGVRTPLRSTINPITPAAWMSFATGTNPGKHGIVDFVEREPQSYRLRPVNASSVCQETFWSALSRHGKRVCIYNVPMTYPPAPVNGLLVSGIDTPSVESNFTYPPDLRDEILRLVPNYSVDVLIDPFVAAQRRNAKEWQKALVFDNLEAELATMRLLFEKEDWDLFLAVLIAPDRLQHLFWRYFEEEPRDTKAMPTNQFARAIVEGYERIDQAIGEMLADEDDVHTILMSDHGFGLLQRYVHLNRHLERVGLLRFQPKRFRAKVVDGLRTWFSKRLPFSLKGKLKTLLSIEDVYIDALDRGIDWARTKVYSQGYFGNIFVNLVGREPKGVVQPGKEYDQVVGDTITALHELRDPQDGLPVVDRVYRKEELYRGGCVDQLPDLVVVMRDYAYMTRLGGELGHSVIQDPISIEGALAHTGSHRLDGILVMQGRHVRRGSTISNDANILDIAPTVLYLMGLPVPEMLDGRVLEESLKADYLRRHPVKIVATDGSIPSPLETYSSDDEEMVVARLKGLGYL